MMIYIICKTHSIYVPNCQQLYHFLIIFLQYITQKEICIVDMKERADLYV